MTSQVSVLVVEDSPTTGELLSALLKDAGGFTVAGIARNGQEAIDLARRLVPDVIAMDINMPHMDGFAATKRIMSECPRPIVIASATMDVRDVGVSMAALQAGALAVVEKPVGPGHPRSRELAGAWLSALRSMAGMKVVRHTQFGAPRGTRHRVPMVATPLRAVGIAASTGGPAALAKVLGRLPADFGAPVVVVQHIAHGFVDGLATWLDTQCALRVKVADDGEPLHTGTAYLAGDGRQLVVSAGGKLSYQDCAAPPAFCPSADPLFASLARVYGAGASGVILSGMGRDGVQGLLAIRAAGGEGIAQDEASCVVFGMPAAAIETGAAGVTLPLAEIADYLVSRLGRYKQATTNGSTPWPAS